MDGIVLGLAALRLSARGVKGLYHLETPGMSRPAMGKACGLLIRVSTSSAWCVFFLFYSPDSLSPQPSPPTLPHPSSLLPWAQPLYP